MLNIEKSDHIICNKKSNRAFEAKKMNDILFYHQLGNTQPVALKNTDNEFKLKTAALNPRLYKCTDQVLTRGGNSATCQDASICQGYKCYSQYHMNDYLLIPCQTNTFQNYIDCDDNKCCSVHHQMFMNITKRR